MKYSFESRKATQDFIPLNIDFMRDLLLLFQDFLVLSNHSKFG